MISAPSRKVISAKVEFASSGSPWKTRWYAHSRYKAARITPVAATMVHHLADWNEPIRIKNSPANPLRPGTPIELNITIMNAAENIGATD